MEEKETSINGKENGICKGEHWQKGAIIDSSFCGAWQDYQVEINTGEGKIYDPTHPHKLPRI